MPELIRSGQWAVTLLNTVPRSVGVTISSATYKGPLYRFDLLRNAWCELQGRLADFQFMPETGTFYGDRQTVLRRPSR